MKVIFIALVCFVSSCKDPNSSSSLGSTPTEVFDGWMNSPGHRQNIEQPRYTHSGFGFKKTSSGVYYWTNLFLEKQ